MFRRQSTFAAAQGDAVVAPSRAGTSLAALFSGHMLQDGEIILLLLKPSLWFIVHSGLKFVGVVLILMISAALLDALESDGVPRAVWLDGERISNSPVARD